MAIVVPSDIVSDVMNAADPGKYQAALDRLSTLRPAVEAEGTRFTDQASDVVRARTGADALSSSGGVSAPGTFKAPESGGAATVYRKFESFVLQVLIESMLPDGTSGANAFGKGTAGNVWRSMMAEQLGDQLAKSGGIGLARLLAAAHPPDGQPVGNAEARPQDGRNRSGQRNGN
jgi:peptidoglycan hydrolase FlgJ